MVGMDKISSNDYKALLPTLLEEKKWVIKGVAIRKRGGGRRMNFVVGVGRDVIG
jgi:hypothetical protein